MNKAWGMNTLASGRAGTLCHNWMKSATEHMAATPNPNPESLQGPQERSKGTRE